jgi:hypothetical protein
MKKIFALLVCFSLLAPLTITQSGCANTGTAAHKVEVAAVPGVNVAMDQWASFVKSAKATQAQVDSVKSAYQSYYSAQLIAKAAEITWLNSKSAADQSVFVNASADGAAKGAAVVALVTTYMTVKK